MPDNFTSQERRPSSQRVNALMYDYGKCRIYLSTFCLLKKRFCFMHQQQYTYLSFHYYFDSSPQLTFFWKCIKPWKQRSTLLQKTEHFSRNELVIFSNLQRLIVTLTLFQRRESNVVQIFIFNLLLTSNQPVVWRYFNVESRLFYPLRGQSLQSHKKSSLQTVSITAVTTEYFDSLGFMAFDRVQYQRQKIPYTTPS